MGTGRPCTLQFRRKTPLQDFAGARIDRSTAVVVDEAQSGSARTRPGFAGHVDCCHIPLNRPERPELPHPFPACRTSVAGPGAAGLRRHRPAPPARRESCSPGMPATTPRRRPAAVSIRSDARLPGRAGLLQGNAGPEDRPPPALRQLGNRWIGILHGCLKAEQLYDENTAWSQNASAAA